MEIKCLFFSSIKRKIFVLYKMSILRDLTLYSKEETVIDIGYNCIERFFFDNRIHKSQLAFLIDTVRQEKKVNKSDLNIESIISYSNILLALSNFKYQLRTKKDDIALKYNTIRMATDPRKIRYAVSSEVGPFCYCQSLFAIIFSATKFFSNALTFEGYDGELELNLTKMRNFSRSKVKVDFNDVDYKRNDNTNEIRILLLSLFESMHSQKVSIEEGIKQSNENLNKVMQLIAKYNTSFNITQQQDPSELLLRLASSLNAVHYFFPLFVEEYTYHSENSGEVLLIKVSEMYTYRTNIIANKYTYIENEPVKLQKLIDYSMNYSNKVSALDIPEFLRDRDYGTYIESVKVTLLKVPNIFIFDLVRFDPLLTKAIATNTIEFSFNDVYYINKLGRLPAKGYRLIGISVYLSANKTGTAGHYICYFRIGDTIVKFNNAIVDKTDNYNGVRKTYSIYDFESGTKKTKFEEVKKKATLVFLEKIE
jgi:hypothetical protein